MTAEPVARGAATQAAGPGRPLFDLVLDRIRRTADATATGAPTVPDATAPPVLGGSCSPPEPRTAGPASPANLAEIAVALRREAGSPCVELTITPDLGIKLSRSWQGMALVVEASPQQSFRAEAELARMVGALRARGIAVATAGVRAVRGAGQAGRRPR